MARRYAEDEWFDGDRAIEVQAPEFSNLSSRHDVVYGSESIETSDHVQNRGGRCRKSLLYTLICISIVAIAIGVGVGVSSSKTKEVFSPAMAPTMSQDSTPGPTPTTANEVMDVILNAARQGGAEFQNATTYQSKALAWVMTQTVPAPQYPNLDMKEQALQLYALACLYFNTYSVPNAWTDFNLGKNVALPGWFSNTGWVQHAGDVCNWYGITCDSNNRVSKIQLDTNGLTGSFPAEVAYLMDSLYYIDLYNNLIQNTGDAGNAWLGELTNLENLYLGTTAFEYDGIPTYIGQLTKLKEFDCSYTLYFGTIPSGMWSNLTNLDYLVMDGNAYNCSLPQDLVTLPNLQYMYSGFSFLEGDLNFIPEMSKIFELWIDNNPGLSSTIPTTLPNADTLVSFSVTGCGLTGTIPSEMGQMTDFIQMWLYDNELTGTIPSEIGNMVKMKIFDVEENLLNGTMPSQICSRRTPFGRLQELQADCNSTVTCASTCCTCCGSQCVTKE